MLLTRKLLGLLNRVFDRDPKRFLALRIQYDGQMTWRVADEVLTTSVAGGTGQNLTIALASYTLDGLGAHIRAQPGYVVPFADAGPRSATILIDASGDQAESNGDHLYAYTSVLWAYVEAVAVELRTAALAIVEMLKQMVIWTASGDWLVEWGTRLAVPAIEGEGEPAYRARILEEVLRTKCNNRSLENIVWRASGLSVDVVDIDYRGGDTLLWTNVSGRVINSPAWVCGPQFTAESPQREWLKKTFGIVQFAPGFYPFGGYPYYGKVADNRALVAAFAIVVHADLSDIDPVALETLRRVIDKFRAAGTIGIYYGVLAQLIHTNVFVERVNLAGFLAGPESGQYTEISTANWDEIIARPYAVGLEIDGRLLIETGDVLRLE